MDAKHAERDVQTLRLRDEVLTNLLYSIAGRSFLWSNMIFQGGGALHFVYSSPRYSDDIDFVAPQFDATTADAIKDGLMSAIHLHDTIHYTPRVAKEGKDPRKGDYLRIAYSASHTDREPTARVEIRQHTAEEYAPATGRFSPLLVESPTEIYADKVVATLGRMAERGTIKPTDLFDLDYIVANLDGEASEDRIERKAGSYGHFGWSPENVEAVLRYVTDPKNHDNFQRVIQKSLLPDVSAHRSFDAAYFEQAARHFERLRHI